MNAIIPSNDLVEFMRLPIEVRTEAEAWGRRLQGVSRPVMVALGRVAREMECSRKTAVRKYYAWKSKGWRGVVNWAKCAPSQKSLDADTVEFWKKLCAENGRKFAPAYRQLIRSFKAGEAIPGIGPEVDRRIRPKGWTYANFMRHKPTPFETSAARIGRRAADEFRPLVFTDRSGLEVGQYYVFDDLWHDFKVVMVGRQAEPMRLLQLHAFDLFSGCLFAHGCKPRMRDETTGKALNLNEDEMLFLLAHILATTGYRMAGTTLLVEAGTATVRPAEAAMLEELSEGAIKVQVGTTSNASAFAGQYGGSSKGNYRFKAALESLGNLIHNETANLLEFAGQTGSNSRTNLPEELTGREQHARALLQAWQALPPARREALRMPFVEASAAIWAVREITQRINQRTEHELQGYREAGLTTVDFNLPNIGLLPGAEVAKLDDVKRAAVLAAAMPVARLLSPWEVYTAGLESLTRFTPAQAARLLCGRQAREVTVSSDHLITLEDQYIAPGPLRYMAHHWAPGTKFAVVVNPFGPEEAVLFDARGRWVGNTRLWQTVAREDPAAVAAQMREAARIQNQLLAPVAQQGRDMTKRRLADAQQNIAALKEAADSTANNQAPAASQPDCTRDILEEP